MTGTTNREWPPNPGPFLRLRSIGEVVIRASPIATERKLILIHIANSDL